MRNKFLYCAAAVDDEQQQQIHSKDPKTIIITAAVGSGLYNELLGVSFNDPIVNKTIPEQDTANKNTTNATYPTPIQHGVK